MPKTPEELSKLIHQYVDASSQFTEYYRRLGQNEAGLPDEATVEHTLDEAAQLLEATLMRVPKEMLVEIIMAFGSNFADLSTPEGKRRMIEFLHFFNDFERLDEPIVA